MADIRRMANFIIKNALKNLFFHSGSKVNSIKISETAEKAKSAVLACHKPLDANPFKYRFARLSERAWRSMAGRKLSKHVRAKQTPKQNKT
jgi:hypothetical protein